MPVVQGLVRLRKHQFGRQEVMGTPMAATRAYPFSGTPSVDLQWTDPEVDAGSIVVTAPPTRGVGDYTAALTLNNLHYNDLPLLLSGFFGGGVFGTGTPDVTWTYEPSAVDPLDDFDSFTYQFGDDVTTDWFQLFDGYVESMEISGADKGPLSASVTWRFGAARSTGSTDSPVVGTVPTPGLTVDTTDPIVYLKDTGLYLASNVAGLGAGLVSDAWHSFVWRFSQETDRKLFADADQTFDVDAYGRAGIAVEFEGVFSKTADIVGTGSESDAWMSDTAVTRVARLTSTSTVDADTATPYSWTSQFPMRYYTRSDGESGGNSTVTLTGHAFYEPSDFAGFFESTVVNTLTADELGETPGS